MKMISFPNTESRFDLAQSDIGSELIQQFHHHWLRICSHGRLPSRADIDPANFKRILPNMILAGIEHDPFRVRYRLCGTRVTDVCGNLTGRYLDEVARADLWSTAAYLRQYQLAVQEARPVFSYDWMEGQFGLRYQCQTGIWPLASDGRTVDMCVAVEDYLKLRPAEPEPSVVLHAL
ncbi:MAG TPA: PAS domain-containing protein [Dongiaceae bacterium]|nr:PAS domain-containing protein [Dongiaceae bacterium]